MVAIEWNLDSYYKPYYYGHLCVWINGKPVGSFKEISTISISASYLRDFLGYSNSRFYAGSERMSRDELFNLLYWRFICDDNEDIIFEGSDSYLYMHKFRDVFWLDDIGEYSFRDKIGMVLIDEPVLKRQRLIWKEFVSGVLNEFFMPKKYFDIVAKEFLNEFNNQIAKVK